MKEIILVCPNCHSDKVTVTEESMFMINGLDYYCQTVKAGDLDAKVNCLDCNWQGQRFDLTLKV